MSIEEAKKLVLALIASGRLPMPSFDVHNPEEWSDETRKMFEYYVRLIARDDALD